MALQVCWVVPPYVLSDIADGDDDIACQLARDTLAAIHHLQDLRRDFFEHKLTNSFNPSASLTHEVVPDYVLEDIANAEGGSADAQKYATETLAANKEIRDARTTTAEATVDPPVPTTTKTTPTAPSTFIQSIYDMESQEKKSNLADVTFNFLPGKLVHSQGQAEASDKAVQQVYDNTRKVLEFFQTIFNYNSLNGQNMPVVSSVHFRSNFQNAAWYGVTPTSAPPRTFNQMVYGDGGANLTNFTNCIDVIGHEMTHAITQFNSSLQYQDESGALNEHISDVFGIMVKQWSESTLAKDSDWLLGEACFMPDHKGTALRNMKNPGTAYDKMPALGGKDPQPADYQGIEAFRADPTHATRLKNDKGGVHLFSGVPNRAFVLCALAFDGYAWDKAGKIWWTTVTTHRIAPNCTFIQFADVTVDVAKEQFGDEAATTVRTAWNQVGVVRKN